ncbi:MAG: SLBB domain-containing protein [Candidatus Riflebacteria bacterium]|nr:SLBB domain-containing protein [Candidatus Riflebacteria bacterium]
MAEQNFAHLGLVGCGGAGFPTQVKLAARNVDALIVNAAECEPLLHKDKEILRHHTSDFFKGLIAAINITGAKTGYIGIKKKYNELICYLEETIPDERIQVLRLGDFYPAGDEYELVYEATGRLIPFGGIPLNIGCVVMNVETLLNIGRNRPVISKFLTITGKVPHPCTVEVPIGITVLEALALAGLNSIDGLRIIDGGPMMGKLVTDPAVDIVSKTCGGLIAMPEDHVLIRKMTAGDRKNSRIARSACDQCTDCSELCPRALLGYPIRPHKAMRTAQLAPYAESDYAIDSVFCSECGLCSLFSCPEDLPPREMCMISKKFHLGKGVKLAAFKGEPQIHPMRQARRVTIERLLKKLALLDYNHKAPLTNISRRFKKVTLPLKMHIGVPVTPLVKTGDTVSAGQQIGTVPEGKLGAQLHASISGKIVSVSDRAIVIAGD